MNASKKSAAKRRAVSLSRQSLKGSLLEARGGACEACGTTPVGKYPPRPWEELHEVLTRGRGGDPTDPDNILCLCRDCHAWVTTHEEEARKLGLVRARTAEEHAALFKPWLNS